MKRFIFGLLLISVFLSLVYTSYKVLDAPSYKIRFNSNGGSMVESIKVKNNDVLDALPISNKKDYEFVGWYLDDLPFDLSMPITKDYTLEAKWEKVKEPVYKVSFDALNGTTLPSIEIKEGTILSDLPIPIKDGYKFITWLYQNKEVKDTPVKNDMVLVAKWEKIN